jgi:hypothetical protein
MIKLRSPKGKPRPNLKAVMVRKEKIHMFRRVMGHIMDTGALSRG